MARLASRPGDPDTVAALEALLEAPEQRAEAARALVPVYERSGDDQRLVQALDALATSTERTAERTASLRRIADIQRKLLQPHLAFAALARAIEASPQDVALHQLAEEAAVEVDAVDTLVEVLGEQLENTSGPARAAIHLRLAGLNERQLSNPQAAIEQLRSAAQASPHDVAPFQGLRRLHADRKEWAALAEVQEKLARLEPELAGQLAAWRGAAKLHEEHLFDEESSLACWLRVLDLAPDDPEGLEALGGLATALDRPAELARALSRQKAAAKGERRAALTLQLAELQAGRLGVPLEAVASCRGLLAAEPGNPEARAFLERHLGDPGPLGAAALGALDEALEKAGEHDRRLELLQARLEKATGPEHDALSRTLEALVAKLPQNPTRSLLAGLKAFEEGGDRLRRLPELLRLAEQADALDELAEAVEAASEEVEDGAELSELLRFAAKLRERLHQPHPAKVLWNDLLAVRPDDAEALSHLSRLFQQSGEGKSAAEVCLRRARLAAGVTEKLELYLEAARFFEDAGAAGEAIGALELSLEARADLRALRALDRLLTDTPRASLHAKVLTELARLEPGASPGRLHLRRAEVLRASDPLGAVAAFSQALSQRGVEAEAVAGLQQLLGSSAARSAAAQALEPLYRERGQARPLAELLEAQLEGVGAKAERLHRLTEVALLWERSGEPRAALGAWLRAFGLAPGDGKVRAELERLAGALGAEEELLAAYEEKLERWVETGAGPLWRRVAELYDRHGQKDLALAAWEKAAHTAPTDVELLKCYADRCRALGDLPRLATVLKSQVLAAPELAHQIELLQELAKLAEESLADDARAAWAYEELSRRSPRDRGLLTSLQRLHARGGDKAGLCEAVARDLQLARESGSEEAVPLSLKLSKLKLDLGGDDAGALELLRGVLRVQPKNPEAVAGRVRLASSAGPVQQEAARAATPLLDTVGDHASLAKLLEAQLPGTFEPTERARLWRQISELHGGPLHDPERAFLSAARALRELPADSAQLQRCLALAAAAGAAEELGALLEELASAQPRGPARAELFRALSKVRETLGERDEAIASWTEVRSHYPGDPEAQQRLESLLEQAGQQAELAGLLQQRADAATPTERPAALLALAGAREKLGQLEAAAETLQTLFALTHGPEALSSLERVLGKLGRHRERAEVLGRLAAGSPDEAARTERLLQQAKALVAAKEPELGVGLLAEVLGRVPGEPRAVAELVALVPEARVRRKVGEVLESVYRDEAHRWQRVAVLEVLVENTSDERERALRTELAGLHEALGERRQAFAGRLRLVLDRPADDAARVEVERVALAANLEEELVAAYQDLLEQNPPPPVGLALRRTVARLHSGSLASPALAARGWEEVARLDPQSLEPLTALAGIYRKAGNLDHLAKVLRRQVALLPTADAQVDALAEVAGLSEDELGDWPGAANAYRQILERAPADLDAVRSLGRVLERLGEHAELSRVLGRQLALAEAGQRHDEAADTEVRLGKLSLGPLEKPDEALRQFSSALSRRPEDPAAVAGLETLLVRAPLLRSPAAVVLERVYRRRNDPARLAEALELQLIAATPERALALLEELATLRESLGDPSRAYAARRELFVRTPAEGRVREELERLAEATGRLDELTALYRQTLSQPLPEPLAVELWRRVAATHERLGQRPRAAEAWEEVALRRPTEPAPLAALCALYREERAYARLPRLLRQRADLEPTTDGQLSLLLELADLAEVQLSDSALAIESCRAALARAPGDAKVQAVLERL
ncbi:MAG: hypothetical protein ACYC8T_14580, partial [Myxococcaceae bacterium]